MQHLCPGSRRHPHISAGFLACQGQVRFFALHRIKPHAPPLVRAPVIPLSFNLAAVLPRRRTYRVSFDTKRLNLPTSSSHRLQRGLPGYLTLFAPHAFAPQRQYRSRKPPSPLMFLHISTHFTATCGIPLPSIILQPGSLECSSQVEPGAFTPDLPSRLRALYAQ